VNLEELARTTAKLDEPSFIKAHPAPALVFIGSAAIPAEGLNVDTPSDGVNVKAFSRTSTMKVTDAFPVFDPKILEGPTGPAAAAKNAHGSAQVVFLTKTARNPFASMITVGRATNNDVCLELPTVSKLHAYFTQVQGTWKIFDQKATNGTFVDEVRLPPGGSTPATDGTRIGIGPDARARFYRPEGLFGFLQMYRAGIVV